MNDENLLLSPNYIGWIHQNNTLPYNASDFFQNDELRLGELVRNNSWDDGSVISANPAEEIKELHKLLDELSPNTSGLKTVAEKLRSILLEPNWKSVREVK